MTFSNTSNRVSVVGSGSVGQIVPFSFPINESSDLLVLQRVTATGVESTLVITTNYTVSITGDTGGTVTTVTAIEATAEIHVIRDTPQTQPLDLENGGDFSAENIEDALDKTTKLAIENTDAITRTLRFPKTDPATAVVDIDNSVDRAGKYLYFDETTGAPTAADQADASAIVVSAFAETYLDDANALTTMATLQGVSVFNVMNTTYGAVGDGVADDTTAVQAAVDAADSVGGGYVFFPAGTYLLETPISVRDHITYFGVGDASILLATSHCFVWDTGLGAGYVSRYNQRFNNLLISGNGAGHTGYAFFVDADQNVIDFNVDKVNIHSEIGGLFCDADSALTKLNWTAVHTRTGNTYGVYCEAASELNGLNFTNCWFDAFDLGAVYIPVNTGYSVFQNCVFESNISQYAVELSNAKVAFRNCLFFNNGAGQAELMPNLVDRDFSGASAWANVDLNAYDETGDLTITADGIGQYCTLPVASFPTTSGQTYRLRYDLANIVSTWTVTDFTGADTLGTISANATQGSIEWTASTTGGLRLVSVANDSSGDFDNFSLYLVGSDIKINSGNQSYMSISGSTFGDPHANTGAWHHISDSQSFSNLIIDSCSIAGAEDSLMSFYNYTPRAENGDSGVCKASVTGSTFAGGEDKELLPSNVKTQIYRARNRGDSPYVFDVQGVVVSFETVDAAVHRIWGGQYAGPFLGTPAANATVTYVADVTARSADNAIHVSGQAVSVYQIEEAPADTQTITLLASTVTEYVKAGNVSFYWSIANNAAATAGVFLAVDGNTTTAIRWVARVSCLGAISPSPL
jgi:hypothetical protein